MRIPLKLFRKIWGDKEDDVVSLRRLFRYAWMDITLSKSNDISSKSVTVVLPHPHIIIRYSHSPFVSHDMHRSSRSMTILSSVHLCHTTTTQTLACSDAILRKTCVMSEALSCRGGTDLMSVFRTFRCHTSCLGALYFVSD